MVTSRLVLLLATVITVILPPSASALDLTRIERVIVREPDYQTTTPRYALVVLGPEATSRVWLVVDGDHLYVDRNGNGDLTESDELVAGNRSKDGQVARFHVKGLNAWDGQTADLRIVLTGETNFYDALALTLDGVPYQSVSFDNEGSFRFADSAAQAPIVHFGGPLHMSLRIDQSLRRGTKSSVMTMIGSRGLGDGAFAALDFPRVPEGIHPVADIELPNPVEGAAPIRVRLPLDHRCCTCNFQGELPVPPVLGPGKARLLLSFPDWKEANVAPIFVEIRIK